MKDQLNKIHPKATCSVGSSYCSEAALACNGAYLPQKGIVIRSEIRQFPFIFVHRVQGFHLVDRVGATAGRSCCGCGRSVVRQIGHVRLVHHLGAAHDAHAAANDTAIDTHRHPLPVHVILEEIVRKISLKFTTSAKAPPARNVGLQTGPSR